MKKKADKSKEKDSKEDSPKAYKKWKEGDKNRAGNDVASEIKIANAGGSLEGGENKQWHMDQGDFDDQEKRDFENTENKE